MNYPQEVKTVNIVTRHGGYIIFYKHSLLNVGVCDTSVWCKRAAIGSCIIPIQQNSTNVSDRLQECNSMGAVSNTVIKCSTDETTKLLYRGLKYILCTCETGDDLVVNHKAVSIYGYSF